MGTRERRLMFVAGENSGDLHAARVITELRALAPDLRCFGFGGERMRAAGMRLDENLAQKLPIIGATQALRNYGHLRALFQRATRMLAAERPDALVLVDYPGFNLRVAREAKRLGIPVVYFISPQIWAWHRSRINTIRDTVSLMLVILPFEESIYRDAGVRAVYVGHPLLDDTERVIPRAEYLASVGIPADRRVIGLIPGSREPEIVRHMPMMLETARLLHARFPDAAFLVPLASTIPAGLLDKYLTRAPGLPVTVAAEHPASARAAMDFAICKSGTSTLEMALAGVPMVIVYQGSTLTYLMAKAVVRIPWIGLVNIVANDTIAPEYLQHDADPPRLAEGVSRILEDPVRLAQMREGLARVRQKLGRPGASRRTAEAILVLLGER